MYLFHSPRGNPKQRVHKFGKLIEKLPAKFQVKITDAYETNASTSGSPHPVSLESFTPQVLWRHGAFNRQNPFPERRGLLQVMVGQALSDFGEFGISPWVYSVRMTEEPRPTLIPVCAEFRVSDLEDHENCGLLECGGNNPLTTHTF